MALRDHSLDGKITEAAWEEFSANGYAGASLRKIAERAGVTVGAIQTRYRSKDELFVCLLKPFLDDIGQLFQSTKTGYYTDTGTDFLSRLKTSMETESSAILHLIFAHYDMAILLLCKSTGSSLEHCFEKIVQQKIEESTVFFRKAGCSMDEKLLGLLISAQFDSYRRIVTECSDRESAEKYMQALMIYHFGGWMSFFDTISMAEGERQDKV